MAVLGIDLGTANSAAAVLLDGIKKPQMIEPDEPAPGGGGDAIYPSYVFFQDDTTVSVGTPARDKFFNQGQSNQVARHFKRLIGRSYDGVIEQIKRGHRGFTEYDGRIEQDTDGLVKLRVGEKFLPIREIAAQLIRGIITDARKQTHGETIIAITVCLPARFDDPQRQETERAAQLAGITNTRISVLEEPVAALVAKGLAGTTGTVLVIDVGAGTTDVILGNLQTRGNNISLVAIKRAGDDLLGGMDMDNLILEYLISHDLKDIYSQLEDDSRIQLNGKIEEAKISVSLHGGVGSISRRFRLKDGTSKLYNHTLTMEKLDQIVAPVVHGFTTDLGYRKGIKPIVEKVLLDAAGGKREGLPDVVKGIDHIVLVGGPCRMKIVHNMLKEVLKVNLNLVNQLDALNPLDSFFMEGVAIGAATSTNGSTSITTSMPSTFGLYTHGTGFIPVIAESTPYKREMGLKIKCEIVVNEGTNKIFTIDRHDECSPREWKTTSHFINVPEGGKLSVNVVWEEKGSSKTTVSGCGLPEPIYLPSHAESFGAVIEKAMRQRFSLIKDIDDHRRMATPMLKAMLGLTLSEYEAGIAAQKHLYLSTPSIEECSMLDVDEMANITEPEIRRIIDEGFYKVSDQIIADRSTSYGEADTLIGKIFALHQQIRSPATIDELLSAAKDILSTGEDNDTIFGQQLFRHFTLLEAKPADHSYAAATATSLAAYAQFLFHNGKLSQEKMDDTLALCWRFSNPNE